VLQFIGSRVHSRGVTYQVKGRRVRALRFRVRVVAFVGDGPGRGALLVDPGRPPPSSDVAAADWLWGAELETVDQRDPSRVASAATAPSVCSTYAAPSPPDALRLHSARAAAVRSTAPAPPLPRVMRTNPRSISRPG